MMQDATKYAKALLAVLKTDEERDAAINKLKSALCLQKTFMNPTIDPAVKRELFLKWQGEDVFLKGFFETLLKRRRWDLLDQIITSFEGLQRSERGVLESIVTAAIPLDRDLLKKVKNKLQKLFSNSNIEVLEKIDPNLLGGIVIEVGSLRYDGSVKGALLRLEEKLTRGMRAH